MFQEKQLVYRNGKKGPDKIDPFATKADGFEYKKGGTPAAVPEKKSLNENVEVRATKLFNQIQSINGYHTNLVSWVNKQSADIIMEIDDKDSKTNPRSDRQKYMERLEKFLNSVNKQLNENQIGTIIEMPISSEQLGKQPTDADLNRIAASDNYESFAKNLDKVLKSYKAQLQKFQNEQTENSLKKVEVQNAERLIDTL